MIQNLTCIFLIEIQLLANYNIYYFKVSILQLNICHITTLFSLYLHFSMKHKSSLRHNLFIFRKLCQRSQLWKINKINLADLPIGRVYD